MIDKFAKLVPQGLKSDSGLVFYSGWSAFSKPSPIYLLGANPGGAPEQAEEEFISTHIQQVIDQKADQWSSHSLYLDSDWDGKGVGKDRMQRRIAHMFTALNLDARNIPSSNLIFTRSTRVNTLKTNPSDLANVCWPFHQSVIDTLGPKIIICMGGLSGGFVRHQLSANTLVDAFREDNNRRWTSEAHLNAQGRVVITLTHPSIADWTNPKTDPTPLVKRILARTAKAL